MKRTLAIVGAGALFLWTGLGLVAWASVARRVTVTSSDHESIDADTPRLLALADEVGALHQDVRALARALGENLRALNDGLLASQDEHASVVELRMNALRDQIGALAAVEVPSAVVASPPAPKAESRTELRAEGAKPRKSFLAFQLPSDDFRFDERRTWAVLPALSRVGFDARTTLHDFTATTSTIEGELEADLARPGEAPRAHLRVQAAMLASGDEGRDEAMREHLAVEEHPDLEFELTRFEPAEVDATALRASGLVHGRMSVRGVTHEVAMPVQLSIDDAHRLCVQGEMALDLTHYGVPVPNKLGLITMEKEVKVWISLRLRANPRSEG